MRIADSLIKDFKVALFKIHQITEEITDNHDVLLELFTSIESIFCHGLLDSSPFYSYKKPSFWNWIVKLPKLTINLNISIPYPIIQAINSVHASPRVQTPQGKGRLLLRILVQIGQLQHIITFLHDHPHVAAQFYQTGSNNDCILTDEILQQIFHSLVADLARLRFALTLPNADFLDESWSLPVFLIHTFVPTSTLGIRIRILGCHYVIVQLDESSVGIDDDLLHPGDVVSSIVGRPLHGSVLDLMTILERNKGKPISMEVAKVRRRDGTLYQPIVQHLAAAGISYILQYAKKQPAEEDCPQWPQNEALNLSTCYAPTGLILSDIDAQPQIKHKLRYIGCTPIGPDGSVRLVADAIKRVITKFSDPTCYTPVSIELGELDLCVRIIDPETGAVREGDAFLQHGYQRISSVARLPEKSRYLAYVAGETTCNLASQFTCFVFLCISQEEAESLVNSISHGFKRTYWAI